ncbi:MAG TPA: hypothetical protein VM140_03695 [Burkholderiales bacterium]|nr:hypothetical protein [Burkholderiales bacterium]
MRDDLIRMLDQYDARLRADVAREKKLKDDDVLFVARFAELRREVVWPVLAQAAEMLAARGHGVEIEEEEFSTDAGGKVREAEISLRIAPAGMPAQLHAGDHERSFSITTRHYNKTVWINAGRALEAGGAAGAKGAYTMERIDRQLIEAEVLKFIGAVMAPE